MLCREKGLLPQRLRVWTTKTSTGLWHLGVVFTVAEAPKHSGLSHGYFFSFLGWAAVLGAAGHLHVAPGCRAGSVLVKGQWLPDQVFVLATRRVAGARPGMHTEAWHQHATSAILGLPHPAWPRAPNSGK